MIVVRVRAADDSDVEAMAALYVNAARAGWAHIFDEPSLKAIEPPADRLRAERTSADLRQQSSLQSGKEKRSASRSSGRLGTKTPTASGWASSTSSIATQARGDKGSVDS
jgi:hypothetical protein